MPKLREDLANVNAMRLQLMHPQLVSIQPVGCCMQKREARGGRQPGWMTHPLRAMLSVVKVLARVVRAVFNTILVFTY